MHAPISSGTIQQTALSRRLLTVRQLAERHPAFTESALRSIIFKVREINPPCRAVTP